MGNAGKRGPDRGPRKRRAGKIAGTKAEAAVKECLLNGGTLTEASRIIADIEGKKVSKDSVARYYRRLVEAAERAQLTDSLARALAVGTGPASGRNVARAARRMLLARAMEAAAALAPGEMAKLPPDRLAFLIRTLGQAEAEADRHRWEACQTPYFDASSWNRELGLGKEDSPEEEEDDEEDGPDLDEEDGNPEPDEAGLTGGDAEEDLEEDEADLDDEDDADLGEDDDLGPDDLELEEYEPGEDGLDLPRGGPPAGDASPAPPAGPSALPG